MGHDEHTYWHEGTNVHRVRTDRSHFGLFAESAMEHGQCAIHHDILKL